MSDKKINPRREKLKLISQKAKTIRANQLKKAKTEIDILYWYSVTINEVIINYFYKKNGNTIFKTFKDWKKEGKQIVKGQKGFEVWGKPRKTNQEKDENTDEYSFFPLAYLFSELQVK